MLAIPLSKQLSWRHPPLVTVCLILVNVLVFLIFQTGDTDRRITAQRYYLDSGLAELEVARYVAYVNDKTDSREEKLIYESIEDDRFFACLVRMSSDDVFMAKLLSEQIITKEDPKYRDWRNMRWDYDLKKNKIVSWRYGFRPAAPRADTLFSHMFLHGGVGHLLGNMVFLWLIGCMIEYGSGRALFLFLYLAGGLAAVGLFWLFNMDSRVPLVGASGAISGIMGAFCVLYGIKKVRIFLTLGFYFNYLVFPAIVMLPLWVGYEILQMLTSEGSNIAYAAHIGGLTGGAAITLALSRLTRLIDHDVFEDAGKADTEDQMIEKALRHMRNLEFDEARSLMHQLLVTRPDDLEILRHLFNMEKQFPESEDFHKTARLMINRLCQQQDGFKECCQVYKTYVDCAGKPRLSTALYVRLSTVFSALGQVKEAKDLLSVLAKRAPAEPGLPSAFLKLANALNKKGMETHRRACLEAIIKRFPSSPEAAIAKRGIQLD